MFGGVSAEILDNPSLEAYHASMAILEERFSPPAFRQSSEMGLPLPWLPLRDHQGWRYEPRWGHAANSSRCLYVMGLPDQEVGIRQKIYLPIERERVYQGWLFASSAGAPVTMKASFRRHDFPDAVLASTSIQTPSDDPNAAVKWHKLNFKLTLPEGAVAPLEPVDFALSIDDASRISIDEIQLYPADAIDGLDPEIISVAKALHSPLLRFGGNFTSGYHWRDGIGPIETRPTKLNQSWGFPEYNLFGTDELMKFCGLIGARPQICLNLGSGTPQEAREWVEYCQGGPNTTGGALRAANGHPEPYDVAAWELGNERWGNFQIGWETPKLYADRYRAFYDAIHDLLPQHTMAFANGADVDSFPDWNGAVIEKDGDTLSYLTSHFVVGMQEMITKETGRNDAWAADFAVPVGVGRGLEPVKAQIDANQTTRGKVKLAYTEWLFWAPDGSEYPRWDNLGGAILGASWMNMLLSHADFVPESTRSADACSLRPSIGRFHSTRTTPAIRPSGPVLRCVNMMCMAGSAAVPEIADVPYLDVLATTSSERHNLVLFVVNRDSMKPIPAVIDVKGFSAGPQATVHTLNADSVLTGNDEAHPGSVTPATTSRKIAGDSLRYEFPAHSVTVISLDPR